MAGPRSSWKPRRSLSKTRLEAFSDGVFAIAITLLILDVAVHPPGSPLEQVINAWPTYVAYLISFLTIGGAWIVHTALTDRLARSDSIFLRLNLFVLLAVSFLPFPTRLLAEGLGDRDAERVAVTIFGLTLLVIRLAGLACDTYARREHLYSSPPTSTEASKGDEDGDDDELRRSRRKSLAAIVGYVLAILVGIGLPAVALAFYLGLAIYLIVPFREIWHLVTRPPAKA